MKGLVINRGASEIVVNVSTVKYTGTTSAEFAGTVLNKISADDMASLETAIAAYQPGGGGGGDYSQGYADGEAAKESAIASSQASVAGQYKSKLASEDATIAAADSTDIDGQGTIFSESYSYLKTSAEMQANYDSGYTAGEAAVATSQQPIASDYKSLLSGVDQTIAAADPTTLAGQLSIFNESYQYLNTGGSEWHSDNPLCFETLSGYGTLRLNTYEFEDFEISLDKINWTRQNDASLNVVIGAKLYIRCKAIKSRAAILFREYTAPFTVKISGSIASLCEGSTGKLSHPYEMQSMFYNATYIVDAGDLILHTESTNGCYDSMFYGCTSLTKAPALPSTTLKPYCYNNMFYGCRSLTKAPVLPATTLVMHCYDNMFYNCSALNEIEVGTSVWDTFFCQNWVYGVSATGTFTKPSGTSIPTGTSGIPSGWNVIDK